jgi:sterol desaturase/sphingolipid hydroxylase (fatty acid hydroxylase superfamily)
MTPVSPVAAAGALFVALVLLERRLALRPRTRDLLRHLAVNLSLSALAFVTAGLTVRPVVGALLRQNAEAARGLLGLLPLPGAARFALGFALMDFAFYWWHRLNHRSAWLWRFHNVHHIDIDLDVSTSFRFHWGEIALSTLFRVAQVGLLGVSAPIYAAYETAFQLNTLFHHSNVRLPLRLERALNRLLVTPRMHGIHHSQIRRETDSNFSVLFSLWDRLHGTVRLNVPQAAITIGVPAYTLPGDERLGRALTLPFRRQRDYWRRPDGSTVERDPGVLGPDPGRLEG